ncbi:hypothetical protein [uncultured Tenacibaculum sp.]|uniref:hypothetical protein n=1 Tax=uncultured Tenacibaculum sp. TaxID=174713 RepID=UPI00260C9F3B|nr:hypothetical protein [uncultured Tenacibaculum sp.]
MKKAFLLLMLAIVSCGKNNFTKNDSDLFNAKNISKKNILINKIKIDTLLFDSIESSYSGFLKIYKNEINFIDRRFGWFFTFDKNGKLISKKLGQGGGPKEINTGYIDAYKRLPNGKHLFIGSSYDVHIHKNDFEREKTFVMKWNFTTKDHKITLDNLDPLNHKLYSPHYMNFKLEAPSSDEIYFPIEAKHQLFNSFNSKKYYEDARIFAKLNLNNGKIETLFGKKSREYLKYKYLGFYDTFDYETDSKGRFYVSFQPDSLVYVYNKNYKNLYSFGNSGRFKTEFAEFNSKNINNNNEFIKEANKKKPKTGFYTMIKVFEKQDLLFRSYHKPNSKKSDGLQIYKGTTLVADLDVPSWFKVIGYIEPYFYSEAVLSEDELSLKSYRFSLPNLKE